MRDIKFRAWHKIDDVMIPDVMGFDSLNNTLKYQMLSFMQFTGFTDKNGVEIYENDLVKKDDDKFVRTGVVLFIHGCWMVANESGESYFNLHWYLSQVEVIGNTHQNPELLSR